MAILPPPATAPRAAVYIRVSSAAQEDGYSLSTQLDRCRAYAVEHGYTVSAADVYQDTFTGIELWDRPQLTRLREAIRRREIDQVVAYAIDRLSRDPVHLGVILSEAEHARVQVAFVTEPLDDTPEGQLIRFVRGYAAKVEHTKITERTQRGRRARLQAGKILHAPRPLYGYRFNADGSGYTEEPITAHTVRRIFTMCLDGKTLRTIAQSLSDDHIPTPSGKRDAWSRATIRWILGHEGYSGRAVGWKRHQVKDPITGNIRQVMHEADQQIEMPEGTIPPLVSLETFAAAEARLKRNQAEAARHNGDPEAVLLRAGIARCGHCGYALRAWHNNQGYWVYRCDHGNTVESCPPGRYHGISAGKLDGVVWSHVAEVLTHPELIATQLASLQKDDPTEADLAAVDRSLAEVNRRHMNGVRHMLDLDPDTANVMRVELNTLGDRRRQLEAERETIVGRREAWEGAQERIRDIQAWCATVAARLGEASYQQKRDALLALNVQVRLFRTDHDPRYTITCDLGILPIAPSEMFSTLWKTIPSMAPGCTASRTSLPGASVSPS